MALRERIENNPIIWLLSTILAGFLAGIGTYDGILRIAKLEVVSRAEYDSLTAGGAATRTRERGVLVSANQLTVIDGLNIAVGLAPSDNYSAKDPLVRIWIRYPKGHQTTLTQENSSDPRVTELVEHWISPNVEELVSLGPLGLYAVEVGNLGFKETGDFVRRAELRIRKLGE